MAKKSAPASNKNRLLIQFRKWHSWGGLFLSILILIVAVTGILMNHKDLVFHGGKKKPTGVLRSTTDLSAVPVSITQALALAHDHYGDVSLEKIELKDEDGRLIYKVSQGGGKEVRIDAETGGISSKYGVRLKGKPDSKMDWAKIVDDLHTGKILGPGGKLAIDLTSGVIIALTLTGIYLWGVPILRKRQGDRRRATSPLVEAE